MSFQLKTIVLVITLIIIYIYFKIETKMRLENRLKDHVKERTKDQHWHENVTEKYKQPYIQTFDTKPIEPENSTDYEAIWTIVIDNWTRNWNYYSTELITDVKNFFSNFHTKNKRQRRQSKIEVNSQNANVSVTGPQDKIIEHYDCDVNEIGNDKYYELTN